MSWSRTRLDDQDGVMAAVTAGFTIITRAEQFYISGADWVGIMGMAYESIAAVNSMMEDTIIMKLN